MKKQQIINLMTVVIFAGILFSFAAAFLIKPADAVSEEERRDLQQFPEFSWENLKDGTFTSDMNTYLNDQFPFRNSFVGIKCEIEKALLKGENNGVVFGNNGQLAVRLFAADDGIVHEKGYDTPEVDFFYKDNVIYQLETLINLSETFDKMEIPFSVILPPRTIDVARSAFSYPSDNSDTLLDLVSDTLSGINFVNMYDIYRTRYDNGEYVYYKTDHHWTTLGAYYAYVEVMKSFGMNYYDISDFDVHTASDSFYGTTYSKSGNKDIEPDTIEYWTIPGLEPDMFTTEIYSGVTDELETSFSGFYDFSYLDTYDEYGMFLSGTNAYTRIYKTDGEERPTLLLLKDSFALSLAPFLALHFNIIILDIAQTGDIISAGNLYNPDKVLICYNLENVVTTDALGKSRYAYKLINGWEDFVK